MKPDVVYASIGARQMHLDLYLPKNGKGPYPAVVYIHGGGWSAGNRTAFQRQAAYMATKGYVGACVEYRLSPPSRCQPEGQRVRSQCYLPPQTVFEPRTVWLTGKRLKRWA